MNDAEVAETSGQLKNNNTLPVSDSADEHFRDSIIYLNKSLSNTLLLTSDGRNSSFLYLPLTQAFLLLFSNFR